MKSHGEQSSTSAQRFQSVFLVGALWLRTVSVAYIYFLDWTNFLFFLNSTKKQSKEEAKVLRQELEEEREERHVVQQELERTTQRVAAMLDSMEGVEKEFHTRGDSLVQLETSLHTSTHAIYALQVNTRSFPCPFDGFLLFFESHWIHKAVKRENHLIGWRPAGESAPHLFTTACHDHFNQLGRWKVDDSRTIKVKTNEQTFFRLAGSP